MGTHINRFLHKNIHVLLHLLKIILSAGSPNQMSQNYDYDSHMKLGAYFFLHIHVFIMTDSHKTVHIGLSLCLHSTQDHHLQRADMRKS